MNLFLFSAILLGCFGQLTFAALMCDNNGPRTGCGFIGIDKALCEGSDYNCCWDDTTPGVPYCFEKVDAPPSTTPPVSTPVSGKDSYSYTFQFTGGVSFCSQCGANGQYACSDKSNWNGDALSFIDKTPSDHVVDTIEVTLMGSYGCNSNGNNQIVVTLNGALINIDAVEPVYQCACATCDGPVVFKAHSEYGFPGVAYGTNNTLSISSDYDTICLNTATIKMSYTKNAMGLSSTQIGTTLSTGSLRTTSPGMCGETSYYHIEKAQSALFRFSDPLPDDMMLVTAEFVLYGRYYFDDGFHNSSTVQVSMGDAPDIQQTTTFKPVSPPYVNDQTGVSGCDGAWQFQQTSLYQNGWPGYSTGSNYVSVMAVDGVVDISRVDVNLYYISNPKVMKIN